MTAEKTRHLARAILLDPENARARGLLGFVKHDGRWSRPDDVARALEGSSEARALLDEYLERRAATSDDADGQYKLALWCEENGLTGPMTAHLRRVVELDPARGGAWRRLGYKKVGPRWVDPEAESARAEARQAQERADKEWRPRLEKLRGGLTSRDKDRRAESAAELAAIADPRAVPALWRVFVQGNDERRQRAAIDVLSRIESPTATTALALIAVQSPHAALRADAAALLRNRDPREYVGLLSGMLRDEIKYKVKPVEGPGSRGELVIEGSETRVERRYTPQDAVMLGPGDRIARDEDGRAVLRRARAMTAGNVLSARDAQLFAEASGATSTPILNGNGTPLGTFQSPLPYSAPASPAAAANLAGLLESAGLPADRSREVAAGVAGRGQVGATASPSDLNRLLNRGAIFQTGDFRPIMLDSTETPLDAAIADARASALAARQQLAADARRIEEHNAPIRQTNERAVAVLKAAGGRDLGDDPESWRAWAVDLEGYAYAQKAAPTSAPATVIEEVPIAYQPQAVAVPRTDLAAFERIGHSCFAAGTTVRTLRGLKAIETILPGDLVLTVEPTTGKLDYKPVVTAFHNPPNATYRIDLGRETISPTGIHRLWKAGHGWIMARDVRPGDRLRTLDGAVEVAAVEKGPAGPVFNLLIDGADDYCVGESGLIAHDNSFVEPVAAPFDLVKAP